MYAAPEGLVGLEMEWVRRPLFIIVILIFINGRGPMKMMMMMI
jgi:hypothetical protein